MTEVWHSIEYSDAPSESERGSLRLGLHPTRLVTLVSFGLSLVTAVVFAIGVGAIADLGTRWLLLANLLTVGFAAVKGSYRTRMVPDTTSMAIRLFQASVMAAALTWIASDASLIMSVGSWELVLVIGSAWVSSVAGFFAGSHALKALWSRGIARSRAVVLGTGLLTDELVLELRHRPTYGVDVLAVLSTNADSSKSLEGVETGSLADFQQVIRSRGIDRVIIGPYVTDERAVVKASRWAASLGLPVYVVPRLFQMGVGMDSLSPDRVRGYPLVRVQRSAHPRIALRMKRAFDVIVAGLAIVLLAPVMLMAAVAVKLTSPGPILFTQERVGQHRQRIYVSKFRSMRVSETSDTEWVADQRITKVGGFLRRSSIDELPQLFAIFRGDMSLVGPRPERPAFVEEFSKSVVDYEDRHRMPVGLTGLAQVVGLRGDTSIEERVKYDNLYIDQWTFSNDLQLLLKTLWSIIRQDNIRERQIELEGLLSSKSLTGS